MMRFAARGCKTHRPICRADSMLRARSFIVTALATLLCACKPAPTRPSATPPVSLSAPAWRGVAVLADTAQAPRDGTLEVVLVAIGADDVKPLAHAEFAVTASTPTRIDFAVPSDTARDAASTQFGWRVWLRDASGRLRYASDRIVVANRGATASVPLSPVASR